MKIAKHIIKSLLRKIGYTIVRSEEKRNPDSMADIGRTYSDAPDALPNFCLRPGVPKSFAGYSTIFTINNGTSIIEEEVFYAHLTLLKMLKHFDFSSVLDIGSYAQLVTRIFRHLGKEVTTIEVAPGYEADYKEDYLKVQFGRQFDGIWCSHVLEHQRNVGVFCDKMFDDLRDGGVLALTVPYGSTGPALTFGHCNIFSPLLILYHLVGAGFDCSKAAIRCYNGQIGIIVTKNYNGILRHNSFAMLPDTIDKQEVTDLAGKEMTVRELLGDEIFDNMAASFPIPVTSNYLAWQEERINWGAPI